MRYFLGSLILMASSLFGDEIYYDNGSQGGIVVNDSFPRFAVRFTPTANCKVDSARLFMWASTTSLCSLFVWDDAQGLPGTLKTSKAFPVYAGPNWNRVGLPISLTYNTDFWIGVRMPISGYGVYVFLYTDNDSFTYPTRDARYTANSGWSLFSPEGDLMIRAIVKYVGIEEETSLSGRIILNQSAPNPTTGNPAISYTLPERSEVKLEIYDITGSLIKTIVDGVKPKGVNEVVWDRKDITGKRADRGIYFYNLKVGNFTTTKKLTLL